MKKDPREFIPEPYQFQMDEAVSVEWISYNCFSVLTTSGQHYRIVNFNHRNSPFDDHTGLETLLKNGLTWPIKIAILGPGTAVIQDERIANEHYLTRFCEVCCPMDLLPIPQRLHKAREIAKGTTSFIKAEAMKYPWGDMPEMIIESTRIIADPNKKLRTDWTVEVNPDPVRVYCLEEQDDRA